MQKKYLEFQLHAGASFHYATHHVFICCIRAAQVLGCKAAHQKGGSMESPLDLPLLRLSHWPASSFDSFLTCSTGIDRCKKKHCIHACTHIHWASSIFLSFGIKRPHGGTLRANGCNCWGVWHECELHNVYICVASRVEIEGYSISYFDHITAFEAPYC